MTQCKHSIWLAFSCICLLQSHHDGFASVSRRTVKNISLWRNSMYLVNVDDRNFVFFLLFVEKSIVVVIPFTREKRKKRKKKKTRHDYVQLICSSFNTSIKLPPALLFCSPFSFFFSFLILFFFFSLPCVFFIFPPLFS